MIDLSHINPAVVGFVGILVGIFLTEYFNRKKRVEIYSQKVFEKRLEIHEQLMRFLLLADDVAGATFEERSLTGDDRLALISPAVLAVANFCGDNELYIDSYVGASLTATFIGLEDIGGMEDDEERNEAILEYRSAFKAAKTMVVEESGVAAINKHFKLVSRSKPDSPIIARIKELEKEAGKRKQR